MPFSLLLHSIKNKEILLKKDVSVVTLTPLSGSSSLWHFLSVNIALQESGHATPLLLRKYLWFACFNRMCAHKHGQFRS